MGHGKRVLGGKKKRIYTLCCIANLRPWVHIYELGVKKKRERKRKKENDLTLHYWDPVIKTRLVLKKDNPSCVRYNLNNHDTVRIHEKLYSRVADHWAVSPISRSPLRSGPPILYFGSVDLFAIWQESSRFMRSSFSTTHPNEICDRDGAFCS